MNGPTLHGHSFMSSHTLLPHKAGQALPGGEGGSIVKAVKSLYWF